MHELVQLNVGGHRFTTTLTTLRSAGGTLAAMFGADSDSGWEPTLLKGQDSSYFIDRDGKHFGKVLNFLRDGATVMPAGREGREELRAEAEYYNLPELVDAIEVYEAGAVAAREAGSAGMAKLLVEAHETAAEAVELSDRYKVLGTTKQTELTLRLPAVSLQLQAATLRLVDAGVRSTADLH